MGVADQLSAVIEPTRSVITDEEPDPCRTGRVASTAGPSDGPHGAVGSGARRNRAGPGGELAL